MSDPEARQVMYDAVWRPGDDAGWDDVDRMLDALAAAGYTVTRSDEVDRLRKVLAYEARVVEAQSDLAAIKGQRRRIFDEQIDRMRLEALGRPQRRNGRWEKEYDRISAAIRMEER